MESKKTLLYDEILPRVEKPGRYIGTEWNSVHKDLADINIRFAFCFPDTYEVGMSHLGMKILYHVLNQQKDVFCERVFAPWIDLEKELRQNDIPLFALESRDPITNFDFVGFTLQYEMSYTNILNMLDLANIPLLSKDRVDGMPFICAGGPCAYNPEPLADIIDFFMMGEGEEIIVEVMDVYRTWKNSDKSRQDFLETIAQIEGIYVPSFYDVTYKTDGTIAATIPNNGAAKAIVTKRIMKDMDKSPFPDKIIVPFIDIVHNRIMVEVFRGCTRGCRFCQAGMIYRPIRERSVEEIEKIVETLIKNTGYEEVSLSSLSTTDYSRLTELVSRLMSKHSENRVNFSLPSMRIDAFSLALAKEIQTVRKSGLTFAPEAGTQRMRDVINKGVNEDEILETTGSAFTSGYNTVKLYFMIGLPTETQEDVLGIAELATKVLYKYFETPKEERVKGISINLSTSSFVPKPFTPFQWEAQDSIALLKEKQTILKKNIKERQINYSWHESYVSFMEAVFARGDRRVGAVLVRAFELGAKFDGWDEFFDYNKWTQAFKDCGVDPEFYAYRKRETTEVLPWDHINVGVSKEYLISEYKRAMNAELTEDCRHGCSGCGANDFGVGVCVK